MYAGDTVIYYAHSDINVIEKVLNEEMNYFSHYFLSKWTDFEFTEGENGSYGLRKGKVFIFDIKVYFN